MTLITDIKANQAPVCKWHGEIMSDGSRRQRLFVDGEQTPFFIDSAMGVLAHRTQGDEHGLYGSGMHECATRDSQGRPRYIAATLGSSKKIATLKHRAEQMAMARLES